MCVLLDFLLTFCMMNFLRIEILFLSHCEAWPVTAFNINNLFGFRILQNTYSTYIVWAEYRVILNVAARAT
jgi:hypothetical protein